MTIYTMWNDHQDANVEPAHREAVVIPDLIMSAHDLPNALREAVGQVWDMALQSALNFTEQVAVILAETGSD